MSEPGDQQEKPADDPIRLKPLVPRMKRATPVPSWPEALCPRCDYNLTGLTSRRCPECGCAFTLVTARAHAFEKSEAGRLHRHDERRQQRRSSLRLGLRHSLRYAVFIIGVALTLLGLSGPMLADIAWPRPSESLDPFLKAFVRTAVVLGIMAPVDVVIAIVAARKGWRWTPVVLGIGVLTCAVGAVIALS